MEQFILSSWWIIPAVIWTIPWKGWALWRSARLGQKWWFIILLVVNTLAVLEILYLFIFSRRAVKALIS
jgi:methionyl-tRNA synthetase